MLRKCSNVLLITGDDSFAKVVEDVAFELEVDIQRETEWSVNFKCLKDVIICDSDKSDCIREEYRKLAVVVLGEGESLSHYTATFDRYIFDRTDRREIALAFMYSGRGRVSPKGIIKEGLWQSDEYTFFFGRNVYRYRGNDIYLRDSEIRWLYGWLMEGNKDDSKRMYLTNMRRRFGKDFLADIGRKGGKGSGRMCMEKQGS